MIAPKAAKVTAMQSRQAYERVKERSFGVCEICGTQKAAEVHHRLHRSHGGQDTVQNLLHVCGRGNHTGCHGAAHSDTNRYDNGWAVRSGGDPGLRPVLYRGWLIMLTADGGIA